jgi:putative ABC transport system ATP-binding protein
MPVPRLELRQVTKTYRANGQSLEVLHGVSLVAEAGTVTALVGRSGCGKTTLLNLAGAMDFPTTGEVLIDGRSTRALTEAELTALRRRRVGFVFQFFQLLPTLTALENVELPLLLAGAARTAETAGKRLDWVGLADKAGALPYQLSGGQAQRVAIARAFLKNAPLLLLDEPTAHLDPATEQQVLESLRRLALGRTVILASHSSAAHGFAGRRLDIRDGRAVPARGAA